MNEKDKTVDTGGGTYVDGNLVVGDGATVVGRDQIINVQGQTRRDLELEYLDGLLKRYEYWRDHYTPLAGFAEVCAAVEDGPRLELPMPFIPREFEVLAEHGYGPRTEVRRQKVEDLREAITKHRRIILLGDPGSGKTTTLWRLVYDYAVAAREDGPQPLPVFVPLGGYSDDGPFESYIARHLGPLAPYLDTYLASGRLILLLDGLNEMPRTRYNKRVERIQAVLDQYLPARAIVSCRAIDYVVKLEGLQKIEVSPLDPVRIRTFLRHYLGKGAGERLFWELAGGIQVHRLWKLWRKAGGTLGQFWTAKEQPPGYVSLTYFQSQAWKRLHKELSPMISLCGNPYLLLMTAQVYAANRDALLGNRARLFRAFVDTLIQREKTRQSGKWIPIEQLQKGLAELAYAMQKAGERGTSVERGWVFGHLSDVVPDCDIERLLYLANSATLLDANDVTVRFYHQLLQEYFAALYVANLTNRGQLWQLLRDDTADVHWCDIFLLAANLQDDEDVFFEHFANAIDRLVLEEEPISETLAWVEAATVHVSVPLKPTALRSIYLALVLASTLYFNLDLSLVCDRARTLSRILFDPCACN